MVDHVAARYVRISRSSLSASVLPSMGRIAYRLRAPVGATDVAKRRYLSAPSEHAEADVRYTVARTGLLYTHHACDGFLNARGIGS